MDNPIKHGWFEGIPIFGNIQISTKLLDPPLHLGQLCRALPTPCFRPLVYRDHGESSPRRSRNRRAVVTAFDLQIPLEQPYRRRCCQSLEGEILKNQTKICLSSCFFHPELLKTDFVHRSCCALVGASWMLSGLLRGSRPPLKSDKPLANHWHFLNFPRTCLPSPLARPQPLETPSKSNVE